MIQQTGTTKLTTMGIVFTGNNDDSPRLIKGKVDEPDHEYESDPPSH